VGGSTCLRAQAAQNCSYAATFAKQQNRGARTVELERLVTDVGRKLSKAAAQRVERVQVRSNTHVPQMPTGAISLYTNSVSISSAYSNRP
jgi:hypothetical protein